MSSNEYEHQSSQSSIQSSIKRTVVKINDKEYILRTIGLSEEVIKELINKKILELKDEHNK